MTPDPRVDAENKVVFSAEFEALMAANEQLLAKLDAQHATIIGMQREQEEERTANATVWRNPIIQGTVASLLAAFILAMVTVTNASAPELPMCVLPHHSPAKIARSHHSNAR